MRGNAPPTTRASTPQPTNRLTTFFAIFFTSLLKVKAKKYLPLTGAAPDVSAVLSTLHLWGMAQDEKLPSPRENFAEWYHEVVVRAGLAEHSPVRGCMIIKPYGYSIWELIRDELDRRIKATGHQNVYFPLFIPLSFFEREAQHVEGFAKECAVVTHHRLHLSPEGKIEPDPEAALSEPLVVRPTSETIIWSTFKKWIHSWRDLPLKINQWANVVRWEMRPRLFLRTTEFLWQEGHTAHATAEEALEEARLMIDIYQQFIEEWLAIPVIKGVKSPRERFAGAVETFTVEALMKDCRALQMGTSHFLGQNFARAFEVKYTTPQGTEEYVWATSWGVSSRLVGAVVMVHGDEQGLRLPPSVAPLQVVIIPIYGKGDKDRLISYCKQIEGLLKEMGIRTVCDLDDAHRPGWKFNQYELMGVPLRIAAGEREMAEGTVEIARRDTLSKQYLPVESLKDNIPTLLQDIHNQLLTQAREFLHNNTQECTSWEELITLLQNKRFLAKVYWDGTTSDEERLQQETQATIRCIVEAEQPGKGIIHQKPTRQIAYIAQAY